jgi:hypothetical protein
VNNFHEMSPLDSTLINKRKRNINMEIRKPYFTFESPKLFHVDRIALGYMDQID